MSALLLLSACGGSNTTSVSPETQLAADQYVERRALQSEAVNELLTIFEAYVDGAALDSLVKNDFSINRKVTQLRQNIHAGFGVATSDDKAALSNGLPMFSVLHAIETAGQMDQIVKQPSSPRALAQSLADQNLSPADQMKAEIRAVVERFESRDKPLRPQMKSYLAKNANASLTSSGHLAHQSSDQIIEVASPMAAAMAAILDAQARGEDPKAVADFFADVIEKDTIANPPVQFVYEAEEGSFGANPARSTPQSIYRTCRSWDLWDFLSGVCVRWGDSLRTGAMSGPGWIPYTFDNSVSPRVRNAMVRSMEDWTLATSAAVVFYPASDIQIGLANLFMTDLLTIKEGDLGEGKGGWANIGPSPKATLKMNSRYYGGTASADENEDIFHVARHELGHVLGLKHEHQRWDRDTYLDMRGRPNDEDHEWIKEFDSIGFHFVELVKRRLYFTYPRCTWKRGYPRCSKATGWTDIWVPEVRYIERTERYAKGSTQFDCLSVMLYGGIPYRMTPENHCVKSNEYHNGAYQTRRNLMISEVDAATIRERYTR